MFSLWRTSRDMELGIIHEYTCANCGARITYYIDCETEEDDE